MDKKEFSKDQAKRYEEIKSRLSSIQDQIDHTFNQAQKEKLYSELADLEKERDKMLGLQ